MTSPSALHEAVFRSQEQEVSRPIDTIVGTLPHELQGTLMRVGPGLQHLGPDLLSWYDGLGHVSTVGLHGGKAFLRSRHVRSKLFEASVQAGRQIRRGVFTNLPGRWRNLMNLRIGNPAAHDVYAWGGKIWATGDDAHYAMDPHTLETLGHTRWQAPGGEALCLMPRIDPEREVLVAYTQRQGLTSPDELTWLELDEDLNVVHRVRHRLHGKGAFVHDLAVTPKYYLVIESSGRLSLPTLLGGRTTVYDSFQWPAGGRCTLWLVPRDGQTQPVGVPMPEGLPAAFHLANAFEEGGQVLADLVAETGPVDFSTARPAELRARAPRPPGPPVHSRLWRCTVDPKAGTMTARMVADLQVEQPDGPPARYGQPTRYAYARTPGGDEPEILHWHGLARLDLQTGQTALWHAGPERFCGPPVFTPRPGGQAEDDGWVLAWVLDAARGLSQVVVLDARDIAAGPLATLELAMYVGLPSHATFTQDFVAA
jgi:all-trans-8'-apo-beta-carotenal 15,15'-oxygenase